MKKYYLILVFACVVFSGFAESKLPNYIGEFRKNPNKDIFSNLLKAKVKTEKEAEKIALNWLGKNHGLLAEEVLIVSGLYKASIRANVHNGNGWIWEIRVTEMTTMLSGVILINSKDGVVDGTILNDGKLSSASNFAIIKEREETISQLIANFKKSNDKNYKISVIRTLGKLRAIEAIPFLIRNIRYGEHGKQFYPKGLTYAAKALSEIGSTCIIPLLDVIPEISDFFTSAYLTNVLIDINGHDLTISHLQKKIEKAKGFREKQLFENILQRIVNHKKNESFVYGKTNKFQYGEETGGFSLAVKIEVKKVDMGRIVYAIVRVKNTSAKTQRIVQANPVLQYFFEVTDPSGKKMPRLRIQRNLDTMERGSFTRFFSRDIESGKFLEQKFNLSRRFDLSTWGDYVVQSHREIMNPIREIVSPKIKFTIK